MNCKSDAYQIGPDPKTTIMVWACDAKGKTHITRSTLSMTVMGTRPRGRPKMRWLDRLKSDMRILVE